MKSRMEPRWDNVSTLDQLWLILDYAVVRKDIVRAKELLSQIECLDSNTPKIINEEGSRVKNRPNKNK
jgi:hypothetical protein